MRTTILGLAVLAVLAGCSQPLTGPANSAAGTNAADNAAARANAAPASATAPAPTATGVIGHFTADGKPAALTTVATYKGDAFDGKAVTDIVFTEKPQTGSDNPDMDAMFGKFGDAIETRVEDDGTVIGTDVIHSGLKNPNASVSISGPISMVGYKSAGGQLSGRLTSGGSMDVFDDKVDIDLTFSVKAP